MLSLNSTIPIKYIKQNKKLQEIECKYQWMRADFKPDFDDHWGIKNKKDWAFLKHAIKYSAPTIADIIDNAEMLFRDIDVWEVREEIFYMYMRNQSIEEISEYILKNIKGGQNEKKK